jgi:hypothetical protein
VVVNDGAPARLDAVSVEQMARFDREELACTQTFAVTDCIKAVKTRRRAVQAQLRKDENALNEAQRRERGLEQLQRIKEKTQQHLERDATQATQSGPSQAERLRLQQEKIANHARQASSLEPAGEPKMPKTLPATDVQRNTAAYAARQQAASKRRAQREKKLKDQGTLPSDLPVTP